MQIAIQTLLFAILALAAHCQHARVTIPAPAAAQDSQVPAKSLAAVRGAPVAERADSSPAQTETIRLSHAYFLFGLYPRNIELSETELCPGGIAAVDQYTSLRDGLFEQLTIGVYSPRTVEVTCR